MKYIINDTVVNYGVIQNVAYDKEKQKAYVKFNDGVVFEFRDKPEKKRAQHIKKLMLRRGEKVLSIGAQSKNSDTYCYGFDLRRSGKVSQKEIIIIKGVISKIKQNIITVEFDNKSVEIMTLSKGLSVGDVVIAMCYKSNLSVCKECRKNSHFRNCKDCKYDGSKQEEYISFKIIKEGD